MAALPTVVVLPTAVLPVAPAAVVVVPAAVPLSSLSAFVTRRLVVSTGVVVGAVVPAVDPPVASVATSHLFVLAVVCATPFSRIALCPARPWIHFMAWGLSSTVVAPFNFVGSLTTVHAADYHVRVIAHRVDSNGTSFNFLLRQQQPLHCYSSKLKGAAHAEPPTHNA